MQGTNRKRGYTGAPEGGYTVAQGGVRGLNFALASQLGKNAGLAQSTANRKVNRGNIEQGASTEWVSLKGPQKVRKGYLSQYKITNFGFNRVYSVTTDYGEASLDKDIISFVPRYSGWVSIKVNGREFNIRCNTDNIQPPKVKMIGYDEVNGGTLFFMTSPFRLLQEDDTHHASYFQVSQQANFGDKLLLDLVEVTSDKTNFYHDGYQKRGTVFARASYEGSFLGFSEWGPARQFTMPKVVTNTAPNLGNGNLEPIPVNLVIPSTGYAKLSTDTGWNNQFNGDFNTSIPTGNSILTVEGKGQDGTTVRNPGQPYIAPSGPIYETRTRQVWVPPVPAVYGKVFTLTGTAYGWLVGGHTPTEGAYATGLIPVDITDDPQFEEAMGSGEMRTVTIHSQNVGKFLVSNTAPRITNAGAIINRPLDQSITANVAYVVTGIEFRGFLMRGSAQNWFTHYFPWCTARRYTVSQGIITPEVPGYYRTEEYQEQVGWTNPGQPYIAPFDTYTTGKSTVVTFQDQVLTFEGGYGGAAVPSTKTAQLVSDSGSGGTVDPTGLVVTVPSGGELTVASDKGFRQTYTGNATPTVPSGASILTLDGRGAPGTRTPNPGLPEIARSGDIFRIAQETQYQPSIPTRYKGVWGGPIVQTVQVEARIAEIQAEHAYISSLGRTLPANPYYGQTFLNMTVSAISQFQRETGPMNISTGKQALENWGSYTLSLLVYAANPADLKWTQTSSTYASPGATHQQILDRTWQMFPGLENMNDNYMIQGANAICNEYNVGQPSVPTNILPGQTFTRKWMVVWIIDHNDGSEGSQGNEFTTRIMNEVWTCTGTVHTPAQGPTNVIIDYFDQRGYMYAGQAYVAPYYDLTTGASTFLKVQDQTFEFKGGYGGAADFVTKFHFLTSDDVPNAGFGASTSIDKNGRYFAVGSPRSETTSFSQLGAVALYEMVNGHPTLRRRYYSETPPTQLQTSIPTGGSVRFVSNNGFDQTVTTSTTVNVTASGLLTLAITGKGGPGSTVSRPGQAYVAPSGPLFEARTRDVLIPATPLTYKLKWNVVSSGSVVYGTALPGNSTVDPWWLTNSLTPPIEKANTRYVGSDALQAYGNEYGIAYSMTGQEASAAYRAYLTGLGKVLPTEGTAGMFFTVHTPEAMQSHTPSGGSPLAYFVDNFVRYVSEIERDADGNPIVATETPGFWKTETYQELVGYTDPGKPFAAPEVEIVDGVATLVTYAGKVLVFPGGRGGPAEEMTQYISLEVGNSIGSSVFITGNANFVYSGAPNEEVSSQTAAGAIYEFSLNPTTGALGTPKRILAPTVLRAGVFGYQLHANDDGSRVFVSSPGANVVYYFTRVNGVLTYKQTIAPTSTTMTTADRFGENLACDALGNNLIVGAPGRTTGAAFVFSTVDGNSFAESKKLVPTYTNRVFTYAVPAGGELRVEEYGGAVDSEMTLLNTLNLAGTGSFTLKATTRKVVTRGRGAESVVNTPTTLTNDGVTHSYPSAAVGLPSEYFFDVPCFSDVKDFGCDVDVNGAGTRFFIGASKATATHTEQGAVFIHDKAGTKWTEQPRCVSLEPAKNGHYGSKVGTADTGKKFVVGDPGGRGGVGLLNLITENANMERDSFNTFYTTNSALESFGREVSISGNGNLQISSNPLIDDNRGHIYVYGM